MSFIQNLIDNTLGKWIGRLDGLKTAVGLLCMAGISAAEHFQWITPELAATVYPYACGLFGIGVIHKTVK